jgi:pimeloyl-ACP methyl ester carboxylesterase
MQQGRSVRAPARLIALALLVLLLGLLPLLQRRSAPAGMPVAATPAPTTLRRGELLLASCEIGRHGAAGLGTASAFCAAVDVPEDWQNRSGRHIRLKVAIVKSQVARGDDDLVTFLDGGPGGAATDDYPAIAAALAPLRRRHDILLIDQRGTGGSNALSCADAADGSSAALPAQTRDLADDEQHLRQCLATVRTHAAPEYYTTSDAIRDLEAVRQALGGPRLDLIGVSYGTRVAQQYARHYPAAVRSVVLDSTVPNTLALGSAHARNLEQALRALFERCQAVAPCQQHFGDSYATLYRVRDRLRAQPQQLTLRDSLTFEPRQLRLTAADLAAIVRFYAYNPLTAALLPLMLRQADEGNYAPLLSQKSALSDDLGSQISSGMELSVICAEDAELLRARPEDADTLLGNEQIDRIQSACSVWPKGRRPADFHQPFRSALPVLVLAGQYDPVTPPAYGEQVVQQLAHARLLLVAGQGHGVIGAGCVPRLVAQFIERADPAAADERCLHALGDTPAFIDFNGASP